MASSTDITGDSPDWIGRGRIPSLDGLRAIAVVLVVLAHAHQSKGFPDVQALHLIGSVGAIGVEVFFVLSGFLITTLMLRELDRTGGLSLRAFYWRRVLRIAPAYVTLMLAVAVLQWAGAAELRPRDWLAAATFTMNFLPHPAWELGHAWSLSIEEHFYFLWPLAVAVTPKRWHVAQLVACIAVCGAGRWVVLLFFPEWSAMSELWTFTRLDTIAIGCLLALVAQQKTWRDRLDGVAAWWVAVLLVLVASLAVSTVSAKWSVGVAYTLNAVCIALLVWAAARRGPQWLNGRVISAVGIGSYSLYLWQQLFLNHHRESWVTAFPQNAVFAALAALGSYWIVEVPFLRLKDRGHARPVGGSDRHSTASFSTETASVPPQAASVAE
ncbi:MAG: acyltransferase [Planctomycetota bacterium]